MASTGTELRLASNRPLIRCRLPGPQLAAHTASSPVSAASPAAANAAASSCRTCSHAIVPSRRSESVNPFRESPGIPYTRCTPEARSVRAECQASGSPRDPEFETEFTFPVTDNDAAVTDRVAKAFAAHFGDRADEIPRQTVSEDFSKIPDAAGVPYTYWGLGYTDRDTYLAAEKAGQLADLTTNHSPKFLPPMQPCLRTGTEALLAAALAWLAP